MCWLGIWLLASLNPQYETADYWTDPDDPDKNVWNCPPFLGGFMSGTRFRAIKKNLRLRHDPAPVAKDRFWAIRLLTAAFNATMAAAFTPAWIMCLDESMVKWLNE